MKIKNKHYPYPVLTFFDTELDDIKFSCELTVVEVVEEDVLKFKVKYSLENKKIIELLEINRAVFGLHLECPSTMKRVLLKSNNFTDEFEIPLKELNKTIDVNFFVLANEKISNYQNLEVDAYSEGLTFEVSKGEILAVAPPEIIEIEKDPIVEINSIFEIISTKEKKIKAIEVDLSSEKIRIILRQEDFDMMNKIHSITLQKADAFLIAMYYTPAIVEALYLVRDAYLSSDEESIDEFRDTAWYKSLKVRLEQINLKIEELPQHNLLGIAHEMLINPNRKAMNYLLLKLEEEDEL